MLLASTLLLASNLLAVPGAAEAAQAATPLSVVNALRVGGCGGSATRAPLRDSRALAAAARQWSRGGSLQASFEGVNYRALHASGIELVGVRSDAQFVRVLKASYCKELRDENVSEAGIFQSVDRYWIILAVPHVQPSIADQPALERDVLAYTNAARAVARRCGSRQLPAVGPLTLSAQLNAAAEVHANDMARNRFFEHEGSDGSSPGTRATRAGYVWKIAGENLALGPETAREAVDGWLASPGHCENLMDGEFSQMGLAVVEGRDKDQRLYWAQEFGHPR